MRQLTSVKYFVVLRFTTGKDSYLRLLSGLRARPTSATEPFTSTYYSFDCYVISDGGPNVIHEVRFYEGPESDSRCLTRLYLPVGRSIEEG